ncbi:MAG TPA: VF530 family protein [Opitutaceae bacterium]
MKSDHPNDPLHGITLETVVRKLVDWYGWEELGQRIEIRCFTHDPSVKSSLAFLRKTPWARKKVEDLYVWTAFGGNESRGGGD